MTGASGYMVLQGSMFRDLQVFARDAASLLDVPFVSIALNKAPQKAVFVDAAWASEHSDIDVAALDNANAVAQNVPFFACVPVRSDAGETLGTLCCGDSDERDLAEAAISLLKAVAAQVATRIQSEEPAIALAHG
jgi:GAF domain-containing protein